MSTTETVGGGCLALLAALVIVFALSALLILVGWNVGVVALVAAAGGHVSTIGFWTALGVSFAIMVIKGLFSGGSA